jgi:hypothetical protein
MNRSAWRNSGAGAVLLLLLWLPLLVSPYPPFYDYPAHLLEARVASAFFDPAFDFASGYVLRSQWWLDTNALTTLAMIGLGRFVELDLAGRLVLGLVLAIFLFGFRALLQRSGNIWPFLLLTPLLAYNFTFTSGWINFMAGLGLGLCALAVFRDWLDERRYRQLGWLAVLLLLIYSAHMLVLALLIGVIWVEYAAGDMGPRRDRIALFAAMASVLSLMLFVRPALVVLIGVGPLVVLGVVGLRRLALRPPQLAVLSFVSAGGLLGACLLVETQLQRFKPELDFSPFARLSFLARTFTFPHQITPATFWLSLANALIVILLALFVVTLLLSVYASNAPLAWRRLAPVGALIVLYGVIPSTLADIAVVEPRIVLFAALLCLSAAPVPRSGHFRQALFGLALVIGLLASSASLGHATVYARQASLWQEQLDTLEAPELVLVLRSQAPTQRTPWHFIESYYDGSYFSAMLPFERGGSSSRVFGNGPFYLRPDLEVILYRWNQRPLPDAGACAAAQEAYDAVLRWGRLEPQIIAELDRCYGPGQRLDDVTIWR